MLRKRIIPASILIVLISGLFYLDHYFKSTIGFTALLCLVGAGALYEFYKMYENIGIKLPKIIPIVFILTFFAALRLPARIELSWLLGTICAFLLVSVIYYLFHINNFSRIFILLLGFFYIGIPLYCAAGLYYSGLKNELIYIVALVKLSDSLAYFGGTLFGKHKLAPTISPNKTVEGFIIALAGGTIIGSVIACLVFPNVHFNKIWFVIMINLAITLFAQAGDLLESMFKRHCQVKDSGKLLGGLGGILDLIDSLLLAFTFILLMVSAVFLTID